MTMPAKNLCMGCMSALGDAVACPRCGRDSSAPHDKNYRAPGSVLGGRYIVGALARKNGESAMYIGYDNNLQARVWIREYFPLAICGRNPSTGDVHPRQGAGAQFKALMSDFVDICNEIKRLGVTEPVIPIENVLGERGTVYAVYRDLTVVTLDSWLGRRGGKLSAGEARDLLLPLYNSLSNIHARGYIHRGISPYTVYVDRNDRLYLWDFCMSAARTGGSELEAELFNGYSAPEQYTASGWQGAWTDVYGAAALFYRVVSGFVPPKSTQIGEQRPLSPLIDLAMDMPRNISDSVAKAMEPDTERRTQDIGSFVSSLVQTELSNTAVYNVSEVNEVRRARQVRRDRQVESRRRGKYVALGMLFTVAVLAAAFYIIMTTYFPELVRKEDPGGSESVSVPERVSDPDESEESSAQERGMPSLIGMTREAVEAEYGERFDLSFQQDYSDRYEEGEAFNQSPAPGVLIEDGRSVIVYISLGRQTLVMPDLEGMTREEVHEAMLKLKEGSPIDIPYTQYDRFAEGAKPGTVVGTQPAAGTEFNPQDTRITIWFMPGNPEDESSEAAESSARNSERQSSAGERDLTENNQQAESSRRTVEEFEREWNQNR